MSRTRFALLAAALVLLGMTAGVVIAAWRATDFDGDRALEAAAFVENVDDGHEVRTVLAAPVPGAAEIGIGVLLRCDRRSGELIGALSFGPFPEGAELQAAVTLPDGRVERFGAPVRHRGELYHSQATDRRDQVLRLVDAALREGAVLSNRHLSVRNAVSAADNRRARQRLVQCAGAGPAEIRQIRPIDGNS